MDLLDEQSLRPVPKGIDDEGLYSPTTVSIVKTTPSRRVVLYLDGMSPECFPPESSQRDGHEEGCADQPIRGLTWTVTTMFATSTPGFIALALDQPQ